ncbi:DUF6162 family protein [Paracoccus aminovorans]|uniref:DUF6162 family protein n=1 Tax=Paracoccus aminovorans TaxID=34004 RepID=UPI002B2615F2|nr:DUF6162 family protein [Paracoccus aminovorans]
MTTRVLVPPASGRRESLAVAVLVAAILAVAAAVVSLHRDRGELAALPGWQIDLRSGLNAAEQGLTADLLNAAAEIPFLPDSSPQALAEEGLPPFVADATAAARGGHGWRLVESGTFRAWLGLPAQPETARAMLLRLQDRTPTVWIGETLSDASDLADTDLADAGLIAAGWRQVVTRYDASVTRKDAPH